MSRVEGKPYFVYVLWSASVRRFYIGISDDPKLRLAQHNGDEPLGWTHRYRPWSLAYTERHPSYADARRRELQLKRQKGGAGFFALTGLRPEDFGTGS